MEQRALSKAIKRTRRAMLPSLVRPFENQWVLAKYDESMRKHFSAAAYKRFRNPAATEIERVTKQPASEEWTQFVVAAALLQEFGETDIPPVQLMAWIREATDTTAG